MPLPGISLVGVVGTTPAVVAATEAASIAATKASVSGSIAGPGVATETSVEVGSSVSARFSAAEAAEVASLRLLVSAVVPLNVVRILRLVLLKEIRNLLLRLEQNFDKFRSEVLIAFVVERSGEALVANARGATDAVNVLGNAIVHRGRKIVVDDMLDVGNIQASGGDASSDHDWTPTNAEGTPCIFSNV